LKKVFERSMYIILDLYIFKSLIIKVFQKEKIMKILIADKLSEKTVTDLKKMGAIVTVNPDLKAEDLPNAIGETEILIVRSTQVTKSTIEAGKMLSLIIRAGSGVNTIDLKTASEKGIHVANCPGKNTAAVAELTMGLMISADRRLVSATQSLIAGQWQKKEFGKAYGLKNRTLGIIGFGSIGKAVAKTAQSLDMKVVAYSRSLTPEIAKDHEIEFCKSIHELAQKSDVVSVHTAYKPETKHIINQEFLAKMKDGAIFINTSRGELVDSQALLQAIKTKKIKVGLDVFENEPVGGVASFEQKELASLITCTPHVGASTDQAAEAIADEVARIVQVYQETGRPLHVVNIRKKTSAIINLVVRHYNRVGVLAGVLDNLRTVGVNIEEMENTVFDGGLAASCTLKLDQNLPSEIFAKIKNDPNIIQVMVK